MKFSFFSLLLITSLFGDLSTYFKKVELDPSKRNPMKHIDYIYLINLDQRPEKLEKVLSKLVPYGITPFRFPGIYGWDLSIDAVNTIGLKYQPGMLKNRWVWQYCQTNEGAPQQEFLRDGLFGNTFYSYNMNLGAIGCTLSHLSVLQSAYDAGFETIWILEDDVTVTSSPQGISELIEKLDGLLGKEGWDILYTDTDKIDTCWYEGENDMESDLKGNLHFVWRPDMNPSDVERFAKRTILSEDFVEIGSRMHTHSMIIRRSGMKKILDFEKSRRPFCPYDNELAFVPGIKLVNLRYDLVTAPPAISDTRVDRFSKRAKWMAFQEESLKILPNILGWQNPTKAKKIMSFIHEKKPQTVVEIGSFGGAVTYPIAKALEFDRQGIVYAIDAWDAEVATQGLEHEKDIAWWKRIDFTMIYENFQTLLSAHNLQNYCRPVRSTSKNAAPIFANGSIDVLFIDGNSSSKGCLEDVTLYLPKVKEGGYIWMSEAALDTKHQAVLHLLKECTWIKEDSLGSSCALFIKNKPSRRKS